MPHLNAFVQIGHPPHERRHGLHQLLLASRLDPVHHAFVLRALLRWVGKQVRNDAVEQRDVSAHQFGQEDADNGVSQ